MSTIYLQSLRIYRGFDNQYSCTIETSDSNGNSHSLKMTGEQAALVIEAAAEAIVQAATTQADLVRETARLFLSDTAKTMRGSLIGSDVKDAVSA